jgi:hypothetical protein
MFHIELQCISVLLAEFSLLATYMPKGDWKINLYFGKSYVLESS